MAEKGGRMTGEKKIPTWLKWTGGISASLPLGLLVWNIATGVQTTAQAQTDKEAIHSEMAEMENRIAGQNLAKSIEVELQGIRTELKLLRSIAERRELTQDEQDRMEYLKLRRAQLEKHQLDQATRSA